MEMIIMGVMLTIIAMVNVKMIDLGHTIARIVELDHSDRTKSEDILIGIQQAIAIIVGIAVVALIIGLAR